jgi:hypothetical protein
MMQSRVKDRARLRFGAPGNRRVRVAALFRGDPTAA